jgi:hypothetical protein
MTETVGNATVTTGTEAGIVAMVEAGFGAVLIGGTTMTTELMGAGALLMGAGAVMVDAFGAAMVESC